MIILILPDVSVDDSRLERARRGDKAAITDIYRSYYKVVYQFVRLRVGDAQTAEDLTSDIFVRFIQALKRDNAPRVSLRGWIFRVARNVISDYYGEDPTLPLETLDQWTFGDTGSDPAWDALHRLEVAHIRRTIARLAPAQQEVLLLRFDQGLSLDETADVMDKNVNAIKALQFRALTTLRELLGSSEQQGESDG